MDGRGADGGAVLEIRVVRCEMKDALVKDIEEAVIGLEKSLREANPEIVALFVKPQTAKTFREQRDKELNGPD